MRASRVTAGVLLVAAAAIACTPVHHPLPDAERPAAAWAPDGPPKAIILALHGFNDYRRAFADFAAHAALHGYRVEAFDQQGFGANSNRGLWPGSAALGRDLLRRVAELRRDWPDTPLYVLGESMGGAVAAIALAGDAAPVDGLILASPAVWGGTSFNPLYRAVLAVASRVAPGSVVTGRGLGVRASDNDAALFALRRDPLVLKATRLDAVAGLVDLMDEAWQRAGDLDLPVLVLVGERDEVIPPAAAASFVERLDPALCHAVFYENGWHLLLRDLQAATVWQDIIGWIERADDTRDAWRCAADGWPAPPG